MELDDAWKTKLELMDSNVNVLTIIMENIVNTKNIVRVAFQLFVFYTYVHSRKCLTSF